jgi:hypothetical protein
MLTVMLYLYLSLFMLIVNAAPTVLDTSALLSNAQAAQKQNALFTTLKDTDNCTGKRLSMLYLTTY